MIWAVGEGLITGTKVGDKDYLDPKGNATRAQVATILMRYLESGPKTLREKIDIMLDTYLCAAHSRFDVVFNYAGSSFTEENFAALLRQAGRLGEEVQIEIEDFEDLKEEYGQGGDGGGNYGMLWPSGMTVIFTDTVTGEVVEEDIEFSIRKCLVLRDLYPNGVLGMCHEDADPDLVAAMSKMNKIASNDGTFVYGEFSGDYTADGIEAFFREYTGLTDADTYEFRLFNFDPSAPGTPFNAMFINKKAEDGKFDAVWNEFVFSGPDPMYARIEEVMGEIPCEAHGKIDVYFGPSSTLTEANMNAFLTELFALGEGYTVEIDSDAFADIFGEYQGAGDGDGGWYDDIPVTFTNTATGETTTEEINLDVVKNLNAQWSGAMDNYALTYCWDDVPQIAKDAMNNLDELNDGEVLLEGDEYTPAVIEAYLRDKSGLTDAEEWQFFLGGFDAARKYDGNEVCAAFKNVVDGRACIVGIGVTFKIEAPAVVDPMHAAFEEFLDEYLCVTHGALTTMHKGGSNYNAANLGKLVLDTMGLDADTYSVVINGDISDPGVGIGQFCGAGNVEIYVKNNTTGEETEHQTINTSSRKLNHVAYDG
ncbi:MAG: hypothetical protein II736_01455, partial [Clostridia bacterium]|nr:hypothetical protein [Clostridia bacterium]